METKNEITSYLENISLFLIGILLLVFPLSFTNLTTDWFILPKQIILGAVVIITLILFGSRMLSTGAVRIRKTPFDFPIFIFTLFALISTLFAMNRADSIISFVPLLFAVLLYFLIINFVKSRSSVTYLLLSLITGASVVSLLTLASTLKIYILPFAFTKVQTFTPMGIIIDQTIYLAAILPITIYVILPKIRHLINGKIKIESTDIPFMFGSIIVTIGLIASIYQFAVLQKPAILPLETGFQTAFAAISQDTGRITQGFLFGSGFGTYANDFTRFKQPAFNLNENFWSLTFYRSSNFILELLATVGFLGIAAFLFLLYKIVKELKASFVKNIEPENKNVTALSLLIVIVAAFVFPFSFISYALFFLLLGLFAAIQGVSHASTKTNGFYDIELHFVAFKKGFFPLSTVPVQSGETGEEKSYTRILPVSFFIAIIGLSGIIGFFVLRYITSDTIFQASLVAASSNNGLQTYNKQVNAIQIFPYRDAYYRIYSQTNLALANSLAASVQKNSSPSAQMQQTIYTLIQQSINSARLATSVSPQTALNWQNLSSIYRSLIGFGQNADTFSLLSQQQAVILDSNNPQEYLNIGGIYYQLKQFENAQRQFQIAVSLKPDFANAHYNLGHALESKGDLQGALAQYQAVKSLILNDQVNAKKIDTEILALEKNIEATQESLQETQKQQAELRQQTEASTKSAVKKTVKTTIPQPELGISTPSAQLPIQKPQVIIPPPATASESGR